MRNEYLRAPLRSLGIEGAPLPNTGIKWLIGGARFGISWLTRADGPLFILLTTIRIGDTLSIAFLYFIRRTMPAYTH
jgi:hypothetical protein